MSSRPWIAYVGPFLFPEGEAASRRVMGMAQALVLAGHDVVVASGNNSPAPDIAVAGAAGVIRHVALGDRLQSMRAEPLSAAARVLTGGMATVRWLEEQPAAPRAVIIYGGQASYAVHIQRWGRHRGVPVLHDVVEWHEPAQFAAGRLDPYWWSSELAMHQMYGRSDGVLAISTFLGRRFAPVVPTMIAPPVMWTSSNAPSVPRGPLRLAYCGSPGTKDILAPAIRATAALARQGHQIELTIAGVSQDSARDLAGDAAGHPSIKALGRQPLDRSRQIVRDADLTLLLREPTRVNTAGFPSKFVESLTEGTGVLGTITSDLGRYLVDGVTGIIAADTSEPAVHTALINALSLSPERRAAMYEAARETARETLDPRALAPFVPAFLEKVEQHAARR